MIIAVDFDGTCVEHKFPYVGGDIGAVDVLKELVECGHKLILYTMRSGIFLEAALSWFHDNGIKLFAYQKNPTQHTWTESPKCYANLYIDDAALGIPLVEYGGDIKPYVNWVAARELLDDLGLFTKE